MDNPVKNFIKKTTQEAVSQTVKEFLPTILSTIQERIDKILQAPIGFCVECKKTIGLGKGYQVWQSYIFCSSECQKKFEDIAYALWKTNHPEENPE